MVVASYALISDLFAVDKAVFVSHGNVPYKQMQQCFRYTDFIWIFLLETPHFAVPTLPIDRNASNVGTRAHAAQQPQAQQCSPQDDRHLEEHDWL